MADWGLAVLSSKPDGPLDFDSYDNFLDSKVTKADLFYLDDPETARQLAQLRLPKNSGAGTRVDFDATKAWAAEQAILGARPKKLLASEGLDLSSSPLLQALAVREDAVRSGQSSTIVFIRDSNRGGQEISGYIDYGHRLKQQGHMDAVFAGQERLLPRQNDLSFYNWATHRISSHSSTYFEVREDDPGGLAFQHRHDRKVIGVDLTQAPSDSDRRTVIDDDTYQQVVLFDHDVRRR